MPAYFICCSVELFIICHGRVVIHATLSKNESNTKFIAEEKQIKICSLLSKGY